MYKLRHYNETVAAIWDSLPAAASEELTFALADVCEDPYKTTEPASDRDDDVERILALQHTSVALLIIDAPPVRRVYIRNITHLA